MIALVAFLAVPLGYFIGSRLAANTAYAIAYLWAFTFQTLYLLLDSLGDSTAPAFEAGDAPWGYGLATLGIFLAGFALVAVGHRLREPLEGALKFDAKVASMAGISSIVVAVCGGADVLAGGPFVARQ